MDSREIAAQAAREFEEYYKIQQPSWTLGDVHVDKLRVIILRAIEESRQPEAHVLGYCSECGQAVKEVMPNESTKTDIDLAGDASAKTRAEVEGSRNHLNEVLAEASQRTATWPEWKKSPELKESEADLRHEMCCKHCFDEGYQKAIEESQVHPRRWLLSKAERQKVILWNLNQNGCTCGKTAETSDNCAPKCMRDPNTCKVAFCGWPHQCDGD